MTKILNMVLLAAFAAGSANMAFADTAMNVQPTGKTGAQPQCRVADLQRQVDMMSNQIAALQAQTPSSSENVIDNLATGG